MSIVCPKSEKLEMDLLCCRLHSVSLEYLTEESNHNLSVFLHPYAPLILCDEDPT